MQGVMLLVLGAIYFALLPAYGFTGLEDFNDPARMTATRLLMLIINWPGIERDPASTNYAMDTLLWGIRNSLFFVVSFLVALGFHIDKTTRSTRHSPSGD